MASYTVTKRINKNSTSWQYDVKHPSFKSGKKRKSGFKTKAEATLAAQKLIKELEDGKKIDNTKLFKEYYNDWLVINGKDKLSDKQQYWYSRALVLFLDYFGEDIQIKNITRSEYQKFITRFAEGRTTETVRKVNLFLSACLKDAIYDGYISKDPTYKISFKGTKAPKKEDVKFMTIQQYELLREHFKASHELSSIMLYVLLITGARFSEVNRLKNSDIDYFHNSIHLRGTKTENADRHIEVSANDLQHVRNALSSHPLRIDGTLFGLSHTAVNKVFKKAKKAYSISDEITPYSLRHTHASYLLSKGIPIEYISKRLGHANISITLNIYTHLLDEYKKEQGQKVRELFS